MPSIKSFETMPLATAPRDAAQIKRQNAFKQLEATLLSQAFEAALPRSSELFGRGAGGDLARSQFASQLGRIVAERGTLGIAGRIGTSDGNVSRSVAPPVAK